MKKEMDMKARFKKATSLFVLGVTLVLGSSALATSQAQAATPWDKDDKPHVEHRDNGDRQKAYEKRQKEIQKKREAEARKRQEAERRHHKKRPPIQHNNQRPDDAPKAMPWNR